MAEPGNWAFPAALQPSPDEAQFDLVSALDSVVLLRTEIPADAFTAPILGFTEFLQPSKEKRNNQVVLVKFPGQEVEMIGLLTRDSLRDLPEGVTKEGKVAVYFPMSYQFGGVTLFIPRAWVTPTPMSVEQAMRSIITAWIPGKDKKLENV